MGAQSFTPWYSQGPLGIGAPGSTVASMPPQPWARSPLDAELMMIRRTPEAQYPDGMLGTLEGNRQQGKLYDPLKQRQNQRAYQRGVHKGERIDPGDYFWPEQLTMLSGVQAQARGQKWNTLVGYWNPQVVVDNMAIPNSASGIMQLDPRRQAQLAQLGPKWK